MIRQCPSCHGTGGYVDVILDDGTGSLEPCGYCKGTGEIVGRFFYRVLGWLSVAKRRRRRGVDKHATCS